MCRNFISLIKPRIVTLLVVNLLLHWVGIHVFFFAGKEMWTLKNVLSLSLPLFVVCRLFFVVIFPKLYNSLYFFVFRKIRLCNSLTMLYTNKIYMKYIGYRNANRLCWQVFKTGPNQNCASVCLSLEIIEVSLISPLPVSPVGTLAFLCIHLSVHPPVRPSVCLSVHLSYFSFPNFFVPTPPCHPILPLSL